MQQLTEEQQAIADHPGGHAKIIAVAGSGKTTALLHYVKKRLQAGVPAERILVLMYNRSAKEDFERRLQSLVHGAAPAVHTFHSLGYRLYQRMIASGHITPANLTPLPQSVVQLQIWKAIEKCAPPYELEEIRARKQSEVEAAEFFIDYTKTILSGDLSAYQELKLGDEYLYFLKVFRAFESWRRSQNAVTYADLIYDPALLLSLEPDIAEQYGSHYEDILVDEYQDINEVQHFLLRVLYGKSGNVIAIGDPDQTIYEWRGSKPKFLLTYFDGDFPPSNVYHLSRTFRYGHQLSLAANHFIGHNRERADIFCVSADCKQRTDIELVQTDRETHWLVEHLRRRQKHAQPLGQTAILVRLWSVAAPVELALLANNIPYKSANSNTVLSRRELRPLFWSLNIAAGRFAQLPAKKREQGIYEWLTAPHIRVPRKVLEPVCVRLAKRDSDWGKYLLELIPESLSKGQKKRMRQRAELLMEVENWRGLAGELLRRQLAALDYLNGISDDSFTRQQGEERKQTILAFCQFLDTLKQPPAEALQHLQALQRQHREGEQAQADAVQITTMHQAKGLEWDDVIIPSLSQYTMPYQPQREFTTPASVESERRLMYVAVTRARRRLYLLAPPLAPDKNSGGAEQQPSLFIEEMQLPLCKLIDNALRERPAQIQSPFPVTRQALRYMEACDYNPEIQGPRAPVRKPIPGEGIRHRKLGHGRVIKWEDDRVEVLFSDRQVRLFVWEKLQQFLL
ncbi:ATP-dependent helicase [Microbulbifer thermotolerans]|uniref:ATP-dependent helicase n=1 Tax=Microbulbifer thermotolerans TaxID=252514 RepID=UPI0008EFC3C8|nr:ATP-dependent helicase [Microbulbifer thermotolerans]MCX2782537.1 ATP-dependent helicase [Microbulbifer thermotolerans]SFB91774.1 DNA helicase-2 / ATP-dependent DNA helicase PcrA [Microbulbifer thermotolerans]